MKNIALSFLVIASFISCTNKPGKSSSLATDTTDSLPVYEIPTLDSSYISTFIFEHPELMDQEIQISEFYKKRNYNCAWFNSFGLTEQAGKVVNLVTDYMESGIVDTTVLLHDIVPLYDTVSAIDFVPSGNDSLVMLADIMFTSQFFVFSNKAWKGIKEDKLRKLEWYLPVNKSTQIDYLNSILSSPPADIAGSEPVYKQYLKLKQKLKNYSQIQKNGGWEAIPDFVNELKFGDSASVLTAVKKRMKTTGDFEGNENDAVFDSTFLAEVLAVRDRYGLTSKPVIDKELIQELNVPVENRIRQILLNLERWKWMPADPGTDFIAVNIPEFMLHVFEGNKMIKSMKVIVGKAATQTVIFSGDLTYVVMSPYWVIPASIIAKETLPAIKKNHAYLSNHNMEVVTNTNPPKVIAAGSINWSNYRGYDFPYTIRQKPGPSNSLGYVKFLFPNSYSIYLHDTPGRNLFEKEDRTLSHGCIRVAEPAWLANYLLRNDSTWNEQNINKAMHSGKEQYVSLKKKVPVYITYFTTWVDHNGKLNFRNDIYGHDKKLAQELFR